MAHSTFFCNAQEEQAPQKEEEEAKGVEMEAYFEGDTFDLPSDAENSDEEGEQDQDEEQRLDQEMGDVGQEGQVIFHSLARNEGQQTSHIRARPSQTSLKV